MVHCFAIARLMGRPGADRFIDHGMDFLWNAHRDAANGGYFWGVGEDGPSDPLKQAYGHAFVLLAASSAKLAGHPDADRLLADVSEVLRTRFWEGEHGAVAEEFSAEWKPISTYRGQNSNMHLTESLMAAFEATNDKAYLEMAESIASLVIGKLAAANGWRVAEHFDQNWNLDRDYSNGDVFRPYGTTPGHSLEWTRLLLQLWELGGRRLAWLPDAAKALFERATADGWNAEQGGFHYTLDWSGKPRMRNRLWWPAAEGIGAAAFLNAIDGAPELRGLVSPHLGFRRQPADRSRQRRLADRAGRSERQAWPVRRKARPLSRAAGLPHPAPADDRIDHARAHDRRA